MTLLIAHRGAGFENSLSAFRKAVSAGFEAVELDVRLTKDGKIVVVHDADIVRVTDGFGRVGDMTLKELRRFKLRNGEEIPTLDEALNVLIGHCVVKIDVKEEGFEEKLVDAVKGVESSVIFTSEIKQVLLWLREMIPDIRLEAGGFTTELPADELVRCALRCRADIIAPHHRIVTEELVERAHKAGLEVHPWTIKKEKDFKKMVKYDVDAVCWEMGDSLEMPLVKKDES